jgi:hypothetical protein
MRLGLQSDVRWHPPLYIDGPFLAFLLSDFPEGLELVARLVDFATDRWSSPDEMEPGAPEAFPGQGGKRAERANETCRAVHTIRFRHAGVPGNVSVYGWSAGVGTAPDAVQAALMALEQYFYMRLEKSNRRTGLSSC